MDELTCQGCIARQQTIDILKELVGQGRTVGDGELDFNAKIPTPPLMESEEETSRRVQRQTAIFRQYHEVHGGGPYDGCAIVHDDEDAEEVEVPPNPEGGGPSLSDFEVEGPNAA